MTRRSDRSRAARQIGLRLRTLRHEAGLTVYDVAAQTGCAVSQIYRIESGRHLASLDTLERLSPAYQTTPSEIVAILDGRIDGPG